MPKTEIDYSNTIFYKISCKCEDNNELYVGHTTNFVQRKASHKNNCNNPKTSNSSVKLYKTIRECGGWHNWNMEIIAFRNCADSRDARKTEQEYYEKLGATLNSIQPLPPAKIQTGTMITNNPHSVRIDYECDTCDYVTSRKSDYTKHLTTTTHNRVTSGYTNDPKTHKCICGKNFKHRQGLWKHKKSCNFNSPTQTRSTNDDKYDTLLNTIVLLVNENREFKQLLVDQNAKMMEMAENMGCNNQE